MSELRGKYGLPLKVVFCKKCTMNNQKPNSTVEFQQTEKEKNRSQETTDEGNRRTNYTPRIIEYGSN